MIGTSLYIVFLLYIPSSFEQTCSSQLLKASSKQNFSENFQNNEDFAKMLLIKKCLNNLEGCAKGIPLKNISEEIFRTLPTENRTCFPLGPNATFVLTNKTLSWNETREVCKQLGGDLATVGLRSCPNRKVISSSLDSHYVWIGLIREENTSNWQWLDGVGERNDSSIWAAGEPNNETGRENCGELITNNARVNDLSCIAKRVGLCKLEKSPC